MTFREGDDQLSEKELELLREMLRDFDRARWLRGQIKWWLVWLVGLPTVIITLWKAVEDIATRMIK